MEPFLNPVAIASVGLCVTVACAAAFGYQQGYKRGSLLTGNYYRNRARERAGKSEQKTVTRHPDGTITEDYSHSSISIPLAENA